MNEEQIFRKIREQAKQYKEEEKRINKANLDLINNLQDRIDKAIEYNKKVLTWTTNDEITDLIAYHNLNILNDEEIPKGFEENDY